MTDHKRKGRPAVDMTGRRVGRWLVLARAGTNRHGAILWRCCCDCGVERKISGLSLRAGSTHGCGSCGALERWQRGDFKAVKLGRPRKRPIEEAQSADDALPQREERA